jgi:hypothetical protein
MLPPNEFAAGKPRFGGSAVTTAFKHRRARLARPAMGGMQN